MVGIQSNVLAAMAVDQDATEAQFAHRAEGDLDGAAVNVCRRVASNRTRHAEIKVPS